MSGHWLIALVVHWVLTARLVQLLRVCPALRMDEWLGLGLHRAVLGHVGLGRRILAIGWTVVGLVWPLIRSEGLAIESRVVWWGRVLVDSLLLLKRLHELLLRLV